MLTLFLVLTIAPALLEQLKNESGSLERKLSPEKAKKEDPQAKVSFVDNQGDFLFELAKDAMASTKLYEGIAKFAEDGQA